MGRPILLLWALAVFVGLILHAQGCVAAGADQVTIQCPRGAVQAAQWGVRDAAAFKRRFSSGLWSGFMSRQRDRFLGCPTFLKRAYLNAARLSMERPGPGPSGGIHPRADRF